MGSKSHEKFDWISTEPPILIWVDSSATVNQSSGNLNLNALYYNNYTTTDYDGNPISADYISGTVQSINDFDYGVFECSATFGYKPGSFPAFWLYNDTACAVSHRSEVDIVELKYKHPDPTLDNNAYYYPVDCVPPIGVSGDVVENEFEWDSGVAHTFKCVYTPNKIEYWVDNSKLHTLYNTNYKYPDMRMHIILCQQLWGYSIHENPYNPRVENIDVPITSQFHWVMAKRFFLAPEIDCPELICTTDTAFMDVDSLASNITWVLTPSNLFTGSTSGTGLTATINASSTNNGEGKITYSFAMPSGETFTAEKTFWVGTPVVDYITDPVGIINPISFYAVPSPNYSTTDSYTWIVSPDAYIYSWMDHAEITFPEPNYYYIGIQATNTCGSSNWVYKYFVYDIDFYMSPNPASTEVEITLSDGQQEGLKSSNLVSNDEFTVTILDKYGTARIQKKYSGKKFTVPVSSLKEGNYFVKIDNGKITATKQIIIKR